MFSLINETFRESLIIVQRRNRATHHRSKRNGESERERERALLGTMVHNGGCADGGRRSVCRRRLGARRAESSELCVCLLLQDLLQSCSRGGRRRVEDMCYERRRAEAWVDESAHHELVNAGGRKFGGTRPWCVAHRSSCSDGGHRFGCGVRTKDAGNARSERTIN